MSNLEKKGIDALVKVFDRLVSIFEDGVLHFRDGVQIWDMPFVPKAIGHIVVIARALPEAIKEAKDLELEEIAELSGIIVARILSVLKKK